MSQIQINGQSNLTNNSAVQAENSMPVSRGARLASLLGNSSADRKSKLKGYEESASKAQTVGNLKGVAN